MKVYQFLDSLSEGKFTYEDKPIYVGGYLHTKKGNTVSITFMPEGKQNTVAELRNTFKRHLTSELTDTARLMVIEEQDVTNKPIPMSDIEAV